MFLEVILFVFRRRKSFEQNRRLKDKRRSKTYLSPQSFFELQTSAASIHTPFAQWNIIAPQLPRDGSEHNSSASSVPSEQSRMPLHVQLRGIHWPLPHRNCQAVHWRRSWKSLFHSEVFIKLLSWQWHSNITSWKWCFIYINKSFRLESELMSAEHIEKPLWTMQGNCSNVGQNFAGQCSNMCRCNEALHSALTTCGRLITSIVTIILTITEVSSRYALHRATGCPIATEFTLLARAQQHQQRIICSDIWKTEQNKLYRNTMLLVQDNFGFTATPKIRMS